MPNPEPSPEADLTQIENALMYALKQSSYWAERASQLAEALAAPPEKEHTP